MQSPTMTSPQVTTSSFPHPHRVATALRYWDDDDYLSAVRYGLYDVNNSIPSYTAFDGQRRREIAEVFNISFNDTYTALDDAGLKEAYKQYVVGRFNRRGVIVDRLWKAMETSVKSAVARSARGRMFGVSESSASVKNVPELRINRFGDPIIRHPQH